MTQTQEQNVLALDQVRPSPENARRYFDPVALAELAQSIREVGIISPIVVKPAQKTNQFEIVAGERRWRAAAQAGLKQIPVIISAESDQKIEQIRAIENVQREQLLPLEEAHEYQRLADQAKAGRDGFWDEQAIELVARKVGKSGSYVAKRLQLLNLSPRAKAALQQHKLSCSAALLIARMPSKKDQDALVQTVLREGRDYATAEAVADLIVRNYSRVIGKADFNANDEKLVPKCGACAGCPKRTGAQTTLFDDLKVKDSCLDPACWNAKVAAQAKRMIADGQALAMSEDEQRESFYGNGQLSYSSPFVDVDAQHYEFGNRRPRELGILKTVKPLAVAIGPRLVLAVRKDELRAFMAKKKGEAKKEGAKKDGQANSLIAAEQQARDDRRQQREQAELKAAIERAQYGAAVEKGVPDTLELWRAALLTLVQHSWSDTIKAVARRNGVEVKGFDWAKPLTDRASKLDLAATRALLFEILFARANDPAGLCKLCGVDPKAVEKAAVAAHKAEKLEKRGAQKSSPPKSAKAARKAERKAKVKQAMTDK